MLALPMQKLMVMGKIAMLTNSVKKVRIFLYVLVSWPCPSTSFEYPNFSGVSPGRGTKTAPVPHFSKFALARKHFRTVLDIVSRVTRIGEKNTVLRYYCRVKLPVCSVPQFKLTSRIGYCRLNRQVEAVPHCKIGVLGLRVRGKHENCKTNPV